MMRIERMTSMQQISRLREEWERLFDRGAHDPSLGFDWFDAMVRNHLRNSNDWFVLTIRRGGELVGIVPLVTSLERVCGVPVRALALLQELSGTHGGILLADGDPAVVDSLLDGIDQESWDVFKLARIPLAAPYLSVLEARIRRRHACGPASDQESYFLQLPSVYGDYLAARSSKFRNHLRRSQKKLGALGPIALEVVSAEQSPMHAFDDLLRVERESWKHANGTAISAIPHQEGFYRRIVEAYLAADSLHLSFLMSGGVPVAHNLGIVRASCYTYLKTSYRESHKPFGVATVARAMLIERLIGDGVRSIDFAGEPYEWERQWTDQVRVYRSFLAYRNSSVGRLLRAAGTIRRGLGRIRGRTRVRPASPVSRELE